MLENEQEKSFLDTNTVMAVALSFGVFVAWQLYMNKKYPPQDPKQVVAEETTEEQKGNQPADNTNNVENSGQNVVNSNGQVPANLESQQQETLEHFEGKNLAFDISNRGMGLKNITLKQLTDRDGNPIKFSWTEEDLKKDIVTATATPDDEPTPTINSQVKTIINEGNFATFFEGKPVYFQVSKETENTFVGRATFSKGQIIKTIVLDDDTYSAKVEVQTKWTNPDKTAIQTLFFDKIKSEKASWFRPSYEGTDFVNIAEGSEERERMAIDTPFTNSHKNVTLSAIGSQYFSLIVKDRSDIIPQVQNELLLSGEVGIAKSTIMHRPTSSDSMNTDFTVFMGPKDYDLLQSLDPEMASVINFGFFGFIAKPMLKVLKYLYSLIGNWGLAIIVLTLLVRGLLFPIAMSSMRSMKKMQKIQPKLKAIREKFKDDPQKMNQETMALMKNEGANPLGGCLPLFAQIPVFFALYSVLGVSIELYKAPFALWIKDLSFQDPYFVMPVLVSVLFFLQMKLSPTQMDPNQQKVMMIMPLVFGVLMFSLPAGLMVYFITNTIFGIGQQFYINREKATS